MPGILELRDVDRTERIECLPLGGRVHQGPVLVLSMQFEQVACGVGQRPDGGHPAVDPRP